VHLAAYGSPHSRFIDQVLPTNIIGLYHVFEEAKRAGVKRVIFASSNHTQFGGAMGDKPDVLDPAKLAALGGLGTVRESDPLTRAGPDSYYAVSKLYGEALGYLYSRVHHDFDFVALRIGWCLYDDPTALKGHQCEDYLRCMWLSERDFRGFMRGALTVDLTAEHGFVVAYAVGPNGRRLFDLRESTRLLGYSPVDDAEAHFGVLEPAGWRLQGFRALLLSGAGFAVLALAGLVATRAATRKM